MTGKWIIESFSQKSFNCGAVVLMKAAAMELGLNKVFKKSKRNGHWIITLRNKEVLAISRIDAERLGKRGKIVFARNILRKKAIDLHRLREFTYICFAIMVRKVQLNGYNGRAYTESEAINLLTEQGVDTNKLPDLLGLKKKSSGAHILRKSDLRLFNKKKAVLLYSDRHIVVVSKGYYDKYGEAVKLNGEVPMLEKKRARAWFELSHKS